MMLCKLVQSNKVSLQEKGKGFGAGRTNLCIKPTVEHKPPLCQDLC